MSYTMKEKEICCVDGLGHCWYLIDVKLSYLTPRMNLVTTT